MSKILVIGNGPLPTENTSKTPASGLRTYHLAESLKAAKHRLTVVCIAQADAYEEGYLRQPLRDKKKDGTLYWRIDRDQTSPVAFVQKLLEENEYDCIVAVNTYPSYVAVRLKTDLPIWCDLNGSVVVESAVSAYANDDDSHLGINAAMERAILFRADKISTVSDGQRYLTYGELGMIGRLNSKNDGMAMVEVIPNANEVPLPSVDEEPFLRGKYVPEDAFIVLWAGAYNNWVDVETLYRGLLVAMKKNQKIYFVSTGGVIPGLANKTFDRLIELTTASPNREKFNFVGWISPADLHKCYRESDIGINVDLDCLDTHTGGRNRINEMIVRGLPVLTTVGSEISYELAEAGAALTVPIGQPETLGEAVLELVRKEKTRKLMAEAAKQYAEKYYSYQVTTRALQKWASLPERAPDSELTIDMSAGSGALLRAGIKYLKKNGAGRTWQKMKGRLK